MSHNTCDSLFGGRALQANGLSYHSDSVQGSGLQAVQPSRGHSVLQCDVLQQNPIQICQQNLELLSSAWTSLPGNMEAV